MDWPQVCASLLANHCSLRLLCHRYQYIVTPRHLTGNIHILESEQKYIAGFKVLWIFPLSPPNPLTCHRYPYISKILHQVSESRHSRDQCRVQSCYSIFINYLDDGTVHALSKLGDKTKLGTMSDRWMGRVAIQRSLSRMEVETETSWSSTRHVQSCSWWGINPGTSTCWEESC